MSAELWGPKAKLSAEAEHDVASAVNLLRAGVDPVIVLRALYCLARVNGLVAAEQIISAHRTSKVIAA